MALNALARDPDTARRFLDEFKNKVLYGTDNVLAGQRQFIDSLGLSETAHHRIYGENAMSLLRA